MRLGRKVQGPASLDPALAPLAPQNCARQLPAARQLPESQHPCLSDISRTAWLHRVGHRGSGAGAARRAGVFAASIPARIAAQLAGSWRHPGSPRLSQRLNGPFPLWGKAGMGAARRNRCPIPAPFAMRTPTADQCRSTTTRPALSLRRHRRRGNRDHLRQSASPRRGRRQPFVTDRVSRPAQACGMSRPGGWHAACK